MLTRFRFWVILSGYDPKDHSIAHKIYLVYASIFWSLWIFVVLAMASGGLASVSQALNRGHAPETAVFLSAAALYGWALYSAFLAARRSPIVFSEDDAYLICQTPVDRRQVTLAWLVGDWPYSGIAFWVLGSVLAFTLVEVHLNGRATLNNVPDYIISALICLSLLVPFHFGLLASVWAFGASRLQAGREQTGLFWAPISAGLIILAAWLIHSGAPASPAWVLSDAGLNLLLLPVRASLGLAGWSIGAVTTFAWVFAGVGCLIWQSRDFNLSRAAQETSLYEAHRNAVFSLNLEAVNEISVKQKLGVQKNPIRLPTPGGLGALIWKDLVQALRGLQFSESFIWLQLLGAALGIFLAPEWSLRLAALFLWIMFSNQIFSQQLRMDLKNWAIFTQLPFDPLRLVLMEISLPVLGSMLVCWLALGLAGRFNSGIQPVGLAILIPGITLGMALITSWDILKQCESEALLAAVVPGVDIWSFVVAAVGILVPAGMFAFLTAPGGWPVLPYMGALLANFAVLYVLGGLVKSSYRKIQ
jgi:hypothetical protein